MQLRRWLVLAVVAPLLVIVLGVLFAVGDMVGLKDTPAARAALGGTAAVAGLAGWWLARALPVRHAAWSLPVGAGAAMAAWLPVNRPAELSMVAAVTVFVAWVAALMVVSVASASLARRSTLAGALAAVVGAVAIVALVPLLAVRLGVGAAVLAPGSMAQWVPAVVTDETIGLDALVRPAAEIASMFVVLVTLATSYVTAYVVRLVRSGPRSLPAPAGAPVLDVG